MAVKTINLTGAEVAVLGLDGANAHIRNDGTEVIYAAKTAGITTGADGVLGIPAGQAATVYGISGTVYMLGTGSAQIISNDYSELPFKTSATSGGSGADEIARAAINTHSGNAEIHVTAAEKAKLDGVANEATRTVYSQILVDGVKLGELTINGSGPWGIYAPSSLPANGGNADTVGDKPISQILAIKGLYDDDMNNLKEPGSYIAVNATNCPPTQAWGTVLVLAGGTGSIVQIYICAVDTETEKATTYIRHYTGNWWTPWVNIADGGNADTLDGKHANDFVLKSDYDALAARVAALEGGTT